VTFCYGICSFLSQFISKLVDQLLHSSLQLSLSAHICVSSTNFQSHPLLSTSFCVCTCVCVCVSLSLSVYGLPLGILSLICISNKPFHTLCSLILLTFPNHLSLLTMYIQLMQFQECWRLKEVLTSTLMMETVCYSETSVYSSKTIQCNNQEDHHDHENLTSYNFTACSFTKILTNCITVSKL
jgi:hypothetical protein